MQRAEAEAAGWSGSRTGTNDRELVAVGRRIAQRECSSCHSIDAMSESPKPGAPPLRDVLFLYEDQDQLSVRLIDGMRIGHDEMPTFNFDIRSTDAMIAFLQALSGEGR
jgi:mono/diheme cytochrome c family protein